jgi:hypothetical protein
MQDMGHDYSQNKRIWASPNHPGTADFWYGRLGDRVRIARARDLVRSHIFPSEI